MPAQFQKKFLARKSVRRSGDAAGRNPQIMKVKARVALTVGNERSVAALPPEPKTTRGRSGGGRKKKFREDESRRANFAPKMEGGGKKRNYLPSECKSALAGTVKRIEENWRNVSPLRTVAAGIVKSGWRQSTIHNYFPLRILIFSPRGGGAHPGGQPQGGGGLLLPHPRLRRAWLRVRGGRRLRQPRFGSPLPILSQVK